MQNLITFLSVAGGVSTIYFCYKICDFVYLHFLRQSTLSRYLQARTDQRDQSWALVTGASDGIGKGFAAELSNKGFNIVLHGRNEAKLNKVKTELTAQWPKTQYRIMVLDANQFDYAGIDGQVEALKDIRLKVLINNVGGSGPVAQAFMELQKRTAEEAEAFMNVNLRFPSLLTRALLPTLLKNSPSLMVNIGSFAAYLPSPYLTLYSGSKAYNLAWSRSLRAEMMAEGHDIEVVGNVVGEVKAQHAVEKETGFFLPTPRSMAQASLEKIGCGRAVVTPYFPHALQILPNDILPEWIINRVSIKVAKIFKDTEAKKN